MEIGFDNEAYVKLQTESILQRIDSFEGKLYLEFGGKLFDDFHASRVLPGFDPGVKIKTLQAISCDAEVIISISANDIQNGKLRADMGITYAQDVLRLIKKFKYIGIPVAGVAITRYSGQDKVAEFRDFVSAEDVATCLHYPIDVYPANVDLVLSDDGFGKNDFIQTSKSLIVVTAPGPGSGKLATCLSQIYGENKCGVTAGYAKWETFPIWNLPLKHPVNLAYEAATADLADCNCIDPFHLEAYGIQTVNYNRDVEAFPVLKALMEGLYGKSPYCSPTDMGVNMAGEAIISDRIVRQAAREEIFRRDISAMEYGTATGDMSLARITQRVLAESESQFE